ncbi:MAG TPA: alpha/beta hydrolase [Pyrinomonadaceae bacterium]|nr:alpha/beta hydrolase [Pyrinomonadaceae bacterium]
MTKRPPAHAKSRLSAALLVALLFAGPAAFAPPPPAAAARRTQESQRQKKPPERYPAGSYNAVFGDTRVHYKSYGRGESALVFIHCWTCDMNVWKAQVTEFAPLTRVIAVDLPGHGQSDKPQTSYTMDYFADAVAAVLEDAGVKRAVLVGHSMGAPVVRQFYRKHPGRTAGLVFVDGSLRMMIPKQQAEAFIATLRGPNYADVAGKMVDGMLAPMPDAAARAEVRKTMLSTPQHVAVSAMEGMADERVYTTEKINVPVLAVLGKSPFWAADTEAFFRSLAPRLEFRMWEGVSHFLMLDRPQEFNRELTTFLEQNKFLKKRKS